MAIITSGAPTSKTPGKIGDHLVDSITGKVYECISVNTYGGHDAVTFKRKRRNMSGNASEMTRIMGRTLVPACPQAAHLTSSW